MNIFYLANNPAECAKYHNDRHCVKMILESAQLLSTAHRVLDGQQYAGTSVSGRRVTRWSHPNDQLLMQATHVNHPSSSWVRQSTQHYAWLYSLFCELMAEYTHRYGKHHKCETIKSVLASPPHNLCDHGFVAPPLAMPDDCKQFPSHVDCYREYYRKYKRSFSTWKHRPIPDWF